MSDIPALRDVILAMLGCESKHSATVPIHETFEGETVWQGEVEVFDLIGHPRASRCYAWAYQDDDGRTQYTAVLGLPPVKSPQDAVKAALVAKVRNERKET